MAHTSSYPQAAKTLSLAQVFRMSDRGGGSDLLQGPLA